MDKKRLERILVAQIKVNRDYQSRLTKVTREFENLESLVPDEYKARFLSATTNLKEVRDDYDGEILNEIFNSFLKFLKDSSVAKFITTTNLIRTIFKGVF